MSKAILVIDKPEICGLCKICIREQSIVVGMPDEQYEKSFCGITKEKVNIKTINKRCPLKPLPQRKSDRRAIIRRVRDLTFESGFRKDVIGEEIDEYATGYNACIDEMLGKK